MENFVFEADIIVPRLESHRHRFVVDQHAMEKFLAEMSPPLPGFNLTLDDVRDLIRNDGQFMGVLHLKGRADQRDFMLRSVAAQVWLNDMPWTITQSADEGQDDPRFGRFVSASVEYEGPSEQKGKDACL
jgi:hypothetical protein